MVNYNEIVVTMTNMLSMKDEPSMRKSMPFLNTCCQLIICLGRWV